uniref:Uncharacterized protein n=1 Tax=Rhizophagus irregularis (strain DAOM 181602 / DAOM 197198 / MUCL 43194) TaxID=747089 RepID=U9U268_RHIID
MAYELALSIIEFLFTFVSLSVVFFELSFKGKENKGNITPKRKQTVLCIGRIKGMNCAIR